MKNLALLGVELLDTGSRFRIVISRVLILVIGLVSRQERTFTEQISGAAGA